MPGETVVVPDRTALYYPRIHFREIDWLKGTLLAFGQVHRVVPKDYPLDKDPSEVRLISERHGAAQPLVREIDPEWAVFELLAQHRLSQALIGADSADLEHRFGAEATAQAEQALGSYEIHDSKLNGFLFEKLKERRLVWDSRERGSGEPWVRVHPLLGEAIMGVSAIATARAKGSDIVTDSPSLHTAVAALDEEGLLDSLLRPQALPDIRVESDHVAAELLHVIMTTQWSLKDVSMEEIAELVRDGNDLRRFRQQLAGFATRIPPELEQGERERRLEVLAKEVSAEWQSTARSMPKKILAAIGVGTVGGIEDIAKDFVKAAAPGVLSVGLGAAAAAAAPSLIGVAAAAAVPIAFAVLSTGIRSRKALKSGPMAFFSRVKKAGGIHLSVPASYRLQTGRSD